MNFNEREKIVKLYALVTSKLMCLNVHLDVRDNESIDFDYVRSEIKYLHEISPNMFLDILWPEQSTSVEIIEIYKDISIGDIATEELKKTHNE